MIRSITVTNYLGDSIKLELARPELSGFAITSIEGLGPVKANINTTEVATKDGSLYNSARLPSRNIVISCKYLWKPTIEHVRQLSYRYFPIKRRVTLLFETDNRTAQIEGYVESNEPTIFSNFEGSDISIICPDPYFYSLGSEQTLFGSIEPMFEFPFSNESLTDNLIEMSVINTTNQAVVVYEGDFEVGITITIYAVGEAKAITIYNVGTRESMELDTDKIEAITGSGIVDGDEITICTVTGKKSISLLREGTRYNILNCLSKDSDWFTLSKGYNLFAYEAETGAINLQFKIENQTVYEGV